MLNVVYAFKMPTLASFGEDLKVFSYCNGTLKQTASYTYKGDLKRYLGGRVSWAGNVLICAIEDTGTVPVLKYNDECVEVVRRIRSRRTSAATFFNWTNELLVSGDEDGNVSLWDIKNKKTTVEFSSSKDSNPVKFLSVNSDDKYIAAAGYKDLVKIYSCTTNRLVSNINFDVGEEISDFKFSPIRKNILACSTLESSIVACDTITGVTTSHFKNTHPGACSGFTFSPTNSNILVSVSFSNWLKIHDFREKKKVFELNLERSLTCVDMLKCEPTVVLGTADGSILAIDLRTSTIVSQICAHRKSLTSLKAAVIDSLARRKHFKDADINTPEMSPVESVASYGDIFSPSDGFDSNSMCTDSAEKVKVIVSPTDSPIDSTWAKSNELRGIKNSTPNINPNKENLISISPFGQMEGPDAIANLLRSSLSLSQGKYLNDLSSSFNSKASKPELDTKVVHNLQLDEVVTAIKSLSDNVAKIQSQNDLVIAELKANQEANRNLMLDILEEITTLKQTNIYEHALTRQAFDN